MRVLLLIVMILAASPAQANWQYATWGMTPAQVVAASAGAARPFTETPTPGQWRVTLATADHAAEGTALHVRFLFGREDRRLQCVVLELRDHAQLPRLQTRLGEIYGRHAERTENRVQGQVALRRTVWLAENHITLLELPTIQRANLVHCDRRSGGL